MEPKNIAQAPHSRRIATWHIHHNTRHTLPSTVGKHHQLHRTRWKLNPKPGRQMSIMPSSCVIPGQHGNNTVLTPPRSNIQDTNPTAMGLSWSVLSPPKK
mmetsp:Transcript_11717/g.20843  ORF Transcript_11717/g.20843 Transcript_11717/m.20843 type:complete len:100 (-) Transcript_11717:546-845(-)